jgi:hypothetical protein
MFAIFTIISTIVDMIELLNSNIVNIAKFTLLISSIYIHRNPEVLDKINPLIRYIITFFVEIVIFLITLVLVSIVCTIFLTVAVILLTIFVNIVFQNPAATTT